MTATSTALRESKNDGVLRCADPSCMTRLSRYNQSERCYAHTPPKFPRIRGRVVEPV